MEFSRHHGEVDGNLSNPSYLTSELVLVTGPQLHLHREFKVSRDYE